MSAPRCKVSLPDFVAAHGERLRRYHAVHSTWGVALHVCLDDGNWTMLDESSAQYAEKCGDHEGAELARLVMQLSPSQRKRLERKLYERPKR